jgi:ABC-type branched-subunit amino acid transport system substrate-binding protein
MLTALLMANACGQSRQPEIKTLYIGGGFALTGPSAEDNAAVLAGFEDYTRYVNENKKMAPWNSEKFPENVNLEVLYRDTESNPEKALAQYDELKKLGMLVFRVSSSAEAVALKDRLMEDKTGATTQATGPYLLKPPQTVFTHTPIYTDGAAAFAEWFKDNWKETRKPRFAYLTSEDLAGKSLVTPELDGYLESIGFEVVGAQYVPQMPTSPPTSQLNWLKDNKVDLTFGMMLNPGSQPTIKEAVRLGMGTYLDYKITFGFAAPSHLQEFVPAMGNLASGIVVAGGYPSWDDSGAGMQFINDLQAKYRPEKKVTHIMYVDGLIEAMTQVEALRLALQQVPAEKLTAADVMEKGFYAIKNYSTGGLSATPLTYGPGDIEGVDEIRVDQVQNGKIVKQGAWPDQHVYAK